VTLSESSRAELIRDLHLRPDTVHVVEPGIDAGYGPGGDRSPTPLVLSVGRLTTAKRVDVMIRAVEGVRRQVPGTRLEIIGDGPAGADLRSLVEGLDATEWVRLRGRVGQPDLLDAYRRAWVLASASVSEGWGMTLTEAAACGTPGVATRIPGHEDAVEDGVSGLLADDDRQLVDHLARVLSDDVGRSALEAGALTNAARYTWERTATEAFRVLASTVGR
jgi:glycosyltransferase involved in cell wall biosynthesis